MAGVICPYCEQPLGKEDNRFRFDSVNFVIAEPGEDESGTLEERMEDICTIYCENCAKILGVSV